MERIITLKNLILAALAALGQTLLRLLGGWDMSLELLVGFMAADYITGLLVAGVFHRSGKTESGTLSSRAGYLGLARKCATLLPVFLGAMLDRAAGSDFVRPAVCLFFAANEGLSVLENLGLMGLPYPAFLRNMLEALKQQNDDKTK